MNSFALCELCHDNGPFYCCFSACHTCGEAAKYCVACWNEWIARCEQQGLIHANCPHCRAHLCDSAVQDLIGRPYDHSNLRTIAEEEDHDEEQEDTSDDILNDDFQTALRDLGSSRHSC